MNNEDIAHIGIITKIDDRSCSVKIATPANCSGCAASPLCNKTNDEIVVDKSCVSNGIALGDKVTIEISSKMTWNAIIYSTVIPMIILILTTVAIDLIFGNDTAACLTAIACVILYYFICRKLNIFTVQKTKYNFKIQRYIN